MVPDSKPAPPTAVPLSSNLNVPVTRGSSIVWVPVTTAPVRCATAPSLVVVPADGVFVISPLPVTNAGSIGPTDRTGVAAADGAATSPGVATGATLAAAIAMGEAVDAGAGVDAAAPQAVATGPPAPARREIERLHA